MKNQKRNERNEEPIYGIPGSSRTTGSQQQRTTGSQQEPIFISDDDIKIKEESDIIGPTTTETKKRAGGKRTSGIRTTKRSPDKAKNLVIQAPEPQPPQPPAKVKGKDGPDKAKNLVIQAPEPQPPQPPAKVRGKNGPDRTLPSIPVATIAAVVQLILLAQIESVPTFSSRRKRCRMI